jgi:hypothetical protein
VRRQNTNLFDNKLRYYQLTVIFSILFALLGFSYNVWRMEVSEQNNNIRTAGFEILINLASLEQLIYAAHYDGDFQQGSPRKGWVLVGLINDLSTLTDTAVADKSDELKRLWSGSWDKIGHDQAAVDALVSSIDEVRAELKRLLISLD